MKKEHTTLKRLAYLLGTFAILIVSLTCLMILFFRHDIISDIICDFFSLPLVRCILSLIVGVGFGIIVGYLKRNIDASKEADSFKEKYEAKQNKLTRDYEKELKQLSSLNDFLQRELNESKRKHNVFDQDYYHTKNDLASAYKRIKELEYMLSRTESKLSRTESELAYITFMFNNTEVVDSEKNEEKTSDMPANKEVTAIEETTGQESDNS